MKRLSIADLKARKEADVIKKLEAVKGGDEKVSCHCIFPPGQCSGAGGSAPDPKND